MDQPDNAPEIFAEAAPVGDGSLRVGPLVALPGLLRDLGQDPDAIIEAAGLAAGLLDDPNGVIDYRSTGRLLAICARRTHCPHLGLLLGQRSGIGAMGLIGLLGQQAPNVGSALRELIRHAALVDKGAVPLLAVEGKRALLGFSVYVPDIEGLRQINDGVMAVFHNMMKALCGPDWRPVEVLFSHSRPANLLPFRRFFKAPLRFDSDRTALVFPAQCLGQQLQGADPELRRILEARISALMSSETDDLIIDVRRVVHNLVLDGRGALEPVAEALNTHRRTLNRRVSQHGWTVKRLIEDERYAIARRLLRETGLSVTQVATVLGYADSTAFSRAYRRWSGSSPGAWRAAQPQR